MVNTIKISILVPLGLVGLLGCGGGGGGGKSAPNAPVKSTQAQMAFQPASGSEGDAVLITGRGLAQPKTILFGDVPARMFLAVDDASLYAVVPPEARSGRIRGETAAGSFELPGEFTIRQPKPRLILFSPQRGPVGTRVLLTGTGFTPDLKVKFGTAEGQEVTVHSLTQATVKVPPGFSHGRLSLDTGSGRGQSAHEFHVGNAPVLAVEGVVITQGSQTPAMDVPLVADRDAFCMVSVLANGPHHPAPVVRVRLSDQSNHAFFNQIIPPPQGLAETPQATDPADLSTLWKVPIPGACIRRGAWLEVQVYAAGSDPNHADPVDEWPGRGQGTRGLNQELLDVREVPTLKVTLVPVVVDGLEGNVDTPPRQLQDWVKYFKAVYPVARVEVQKGSPLHWNGRFTGDDAQDRHLQENLLAQLEARRVSDGKAFNEIYYGVVKNPRPRGFGGMGLYPDPYGRANLNRVALGGDWNEAIPGDNRGFAWVFAHEMGHVLGCLHAPSFPPGYPIEGVDNNYPYPKGDIGAFGFDVAAQEIKAPGSYKDVMSYTPPLWISDYHYKKILDYLYRLHILHP